MRDEELFPDIRNGDPLLFRGGMLHSRFIQRWTKSVYSHVGLALWIVCDGLKRLAVIEAMEGRGVQVHPLSEYLVRKNHVDWFAITDDTIDRDQVVAWALEKWGKRYASPRQLIRSFVTVPLASWLGLPTKIDHDRWFCSWFAASALRAGGWNPDENDELPPELVSPGEVALFTCLQRRGKLVLETQLERVLQ